VFDTLAFFLWANPRRSHIGSQAESRTLLCSTLQKIKKETLITAIHATHCIPKRGVNFGTLLQQSATSDTATHCNTLPHTASQQVECTLGQGGISMAQACTHKYHTDNRSRTHTHTHTHTSDKVSVCQSIEMRIWKDSTTRALMRTCVDSTPPTPTLYSIFPPPTTFALTLLNPSCKSCLLCQNSPIKIGLFCGRD